MKTTLSIALLTLGATGLQAGQDPNANPVEQYLDASPVAELRAQAVRLESAIVGLEQESELQRLEESAELMLASQKQLGAMRLQALDLEFERERLDQALDVLEERYDERRGMLDDERDERCNANEAKAEHERELAENRLDLELLQLYQGDPDGPESELIDGKLRMIAREGERVLDVEERRADAAIRADLSQEREKLREERRHEELVLRTELQDLERESLRAEMAIEAHESSFDMRMEQVQLRAEIVARRERAELEARLSAVEAVLEAHEDGQSHASDLNDLLSMLEDEIIALRADVDRLANLIDEGF